MVYAELYKYCCITTSILRTKTFIFIFIMKSLYFIWVLFGFTFCCNVIVTRMSDNKQFNLSDVRVNASVTKIAWFIHGMIYSVPYVSDNLTTIIPTPAFDRDVLYVNWTDHCGFNDFNYLQIISAYYGAQKVGKLLARSYLGRNKTYSHTCIGHSLGAHVCGFFGGRMMKTTKSIPVMDKIVAFDPPKGLFLKIFGIRIGLMGLVKRKTKLLVIIHTSNLLFMISKSAGHVDLYANTPVDTGCFDGSQIPYVPNVDIYNDLGCPHNIIFPMLFRMRYENRSYSFTHRTNEDNSYILEPDFFFSKHNNTHTGQYYIKLHKLGIPINSTDIDSGSGSGFYANFNSY